MVDMNLVNDGSGKTTEEKIQDEIAGDDTLLTFAMANTTGGSGEQSQPFMEATYKQGVTFEWVKNQVAEKLEAKYEDVSLYLGEKRIPEPFCLVDMGV